MMKYNLCFLNITAHLYKLIFFLLNSKVTVLPFLSSDCHFSTRVLLEIGKTSVIIWCSLQAEIHDYPSAFPIFTGNGEV